MSFNNANNYVQLKIIVNLLYSVGVHYITVIMCIQSSFISLVIIAFAEMLCPKSVYLSFLVGITLFTDNWLSWARLHFIPWQFMLSFGWSLLEETIKSVQ